MKTQERTAAMAAIEAILFMMGESVEIGRLMQVLECSRDEAEECLALLEEKYKAPDCGLALRRFEDAVQLSTKEEQFDTLVRIARAPKKLALSDSMMETLSLIAYKQPVTRLEIENIRGVNSDFAINKLVSYDLVRELGRKDAPGRPLLFGTTEQFLRSFGVRSLEDLPDISAVQKEEVKQEVTQEVNTRLSI